MSEELTPTSTRATKTNVSTRVNTFISSRRSGMWGVAEIAAVSVSSFVLFLVLLSYLYFMIPARSRVSTLTAERAQLQTNLVKSKQILTTQQTTQETAHGILESLNSFETASLQQEAQGRMDLYGELNQLMVKNGLRNTAGPTYTPLAPLGTKTVAGTSTSTKWQTAYPGIAVSVTVEGSYQSLRQFIKDIERSKLLIIINQVELQRAQNEGAATVPTEGSGTRSSLVSLQLSMATYFRRIEAEASTSQEQ